MADDIEADLFTVTQRFVDAVYLWVVGDGSGPEAAIREACNLLVAGNDDDAVAELAGMSSAADYWDVLPVAETALHALGYHLWARETDTAQMAAARAQARRALRGELSPRDFTAWAHTTIGHGGPAAAQPIVNADDEYDDWNDTPASRSSVDARVLRLARELASE